ncbi:reverse transcriptase domain-containing protein [Tanacetum coccineum]
MLKRLAENKFFCFLDGFSGDFQIPIEPADQEKTTFTYPYGTYAYKRMPFGLCNAPATFQRCMIAIFQDMLETSMEVSMDDFLVFGDSFDSCLVNIKQMLVRCKQAHLVPYWEKCHFIVTKGIVLGHKVSNAGLEFDKAKIDVITKLPPPTNVKSVRSFLGHTGFYRRFIKDFPKISRPMTKLLEKDVVFYFNKECIEAFELLKEKVTNAPIMISPDWLQLFELMCDASDFAVGAVLGQQEGKNFRPVHFASKPLNNAQQNFTFDIEIKNKKGAENVAADHLLRLENPHLEELRDDDINDNFPDETLMNVSSTEEDKIPLQAYENSKLYKARTKAYHDRKLRIRKELKAREKVLLYNSKYKFKAPKLRSKWYGPFVVKHGHPSGYVKLYDKHEGSFIVNGHRVKLYYDEEKINELTTKEIYLMCEQGKMKAIPFMAPFPAEYHETMPWVAEKPFIYSVVENTCIEAKLYDLDETCKGLVKGNFFYVKKDPSKKSPLGKNEGQEV